ncbi:MAG TPA: thioredoxin family protein [Bacteroidales bacterium]
MKNLIPALILLLISFTACKTVKPVANTGSNKAQTTITTPDAKPEEFNFSEQSTWLLGYVNPGQFSRLPYSTWYLKGFDDYQFNSDAINKLLEINKDNLTIKVVMGTWCPDSRREVPRFMRVLNIWQFTSEKLTILGVDNAKLCPIGDFDKLNIQRVPTFIMYKNNIEVGRIIENPVTSLEQDMVNILTKKE